MAKHTRPSIAPFAPSSAHEQCGPVAKPRGLIGQHAHAMGSLPGRRPRKAEALKQSRLLRGLLELVEPVEHGAATRPSKKLRLEEGEALQGGLSLH